LDALWNWGEVRLLDEDYGMGPVTLPWLSDSLNAALTSLQVRVWTDPDVNKEALTQQANVVMEKLQQLVRHLKTKYAKEKLAELTIKNNASEEEAKCKNKDEVAALRLELLQEQAKRIKEMKEAFKMNRALQAEDEDQEAAATRRTTEKDMEKRYGEHSLSSDTAF
jgi:hypothetical protein